MQRLLVVAAAGLLVLLRAGPGEAAWYTSCPACARGLGGSGIAGPYPDKATCDYYRAKMRADNFAFGPCYESGASAPAPSAPPSPAPSSPPPSSGPAPSRPVPILRSPERSLPLVDCAEARATIPRLNGFLEQLKTNPTQLMAVSRTEAIVRAETQNIEQLEARQKEALTRYGIELLADALAGIKETKSVLQKIADARSPAEKQRLMNDAFGKLVDIENSIARIQPGTPPKEAREIIATAMRRALELDAKFKQPGYFGPGYDAATGAATKIVVVLGGPMAKLTVSFGKAAITFVALEEERWISAGTRLDAQEALERLRYSERNARDKIHMAEVALDDVAHGRAACGDVYAVR